MSGKIALVLFCLTVAGAAIAQCSSDKWKPEPPTHVVRVSQLAFYGTQLPIAEQNKIAAAVATDDYADSFDSSAWRYELQERIRDKWLQRGYFKAQVDIVDIRKLREDGEHTDAGIAAQVEDGTQYRIREITFTHATVFSQDRLRSLFPLKKGDIFAIAEIREGLENLRKLYDANGYINFTPVSDTTIHDEDGSISLTVDLDEGKQLHLNIRVLADTPEEQQRIVDQCGIAKVQGTVFNQEAVRALLARCEAVVGRESRQSCDIDLELSEKSSSADVVFDFRSDEP